MARCEEAGFTFHTINGSKYWNENAYYDLTEREIDLLDDATTELHQMCLQAVERVVSKGEYERFYIPQTFCSAIERSWNTRQPTLYGRFDLAYRGTSTPRLLEYNADTPTALLEASVVQWHWLQDIYPGQPVDQFNLIHENLIARWAEIWKQIPGTEKRLYLSCLNSSEEDQCTVAYLMDTALQAKIDATLIPIKTIGWDHSKKQFVDEASQPISNIFKLYPWEWLLNDKFGSHIPGTKVRWLEPAWKLVLSNKALLPLLWEMFPGHKYLLEAYTEPAKLRDGPYVEKPIYSREGANISIVDGSSIISSPGAYAASPKIYQRHEQLFCGSSDTYAVLGSWIIGDKASGLGIREDASPITRNTSQFVPHLFR